MITITFTSEYFSGMQSFTEDKKAEEFLKMIKKNHVINIQPVLSTNYHIASHNKRYPYDIQSLKEVPSLKINIQHDTN